MKQIKLKVKKIFKTATLPSYSRAGDAGLDLVAHRIEETDNNVICFTGIAIEIPEGHVGKLYPRSSVTKTNQYLGNSVGIIDENYRGEIILKFNKAFGQISKGNPSPKLYKPGNKVGQLIIEERIHVDIEETEELSESNRGSSGFGSSGE